jgi:hypothetical protein
VKYIIVKPTKGTKRPWLYLLKAGELTSLPYELREAEPPPKRTSPYKANPVRG